MTALPRKKGIEQVCKANNSVQSLHMSMQQLCTVVAYGYATTLYSRCERICNNIVTPGRIWLNTVVTNIRLEKVDFAE